MTMNNAKILLKPQPMKSQTPMLTSSTLPTLPGYVFRLNQLLAEAEPEMDEVTQVIRTDASLAAQVLRLANLYRMESDQPVSSVKKAVQIVGVARLRTMVITCPLLDCAANSAQLASLQSFWQHNFMAGEMSQSLAEFLGYEGIEMAYTAGLLRDIGELSLIARAQLDGSVWPQAETAGSSRTRSKEAGRRMAIACKLTPELVEVCGCGDDPARAWHDPLLVKIVIAASRFCEANGLISGGAPRQLMCGCDSEQVKSGLAELFRISPERTDGMFAALCHRFRKLMPELEFNHAGLLNAASVQVVAEEAEQTMQFAAIA